MSLNIIQKPSKNYSSRNGYKPDMIVNHITAGNTASSALNWFQSPNNQQSSAHFVVDKDGTIYQCVPIDKAAWAQGTSTNPSSNMYYGKSKLSLIQSRKTNCNYYSIGIEHVNAGGGALTSSQLKSTIELHKYIISEVKRIYGTDIPVDRDHITGHCFVNPITKPCCPGKDFPYDQIISGIKGCNSNPTPTYVKSDTTGDFTIYKNESYTFKISSDAEPKFQIGTPNVFKTELINRMGDDYYYRITAIGSEGSGAGIFVNGKKICVVNINVTNNTPYSDTTGNFEIKKGNCYQFKTNMPIICGNGNIFQSVFQTRSNGYYLTKFKAVGNIGDSAGFYLDNDKNAIAVAKIV